VVTAQKREENLQDVPICVNAFSGTELEARGVLDRKTCSYLTPGLVYDELAGLFDHLPSRIGTDGFLPGGDLSVATTSTASISRARTGSRASSTSSSVWKLLKGPQGTLFGRNSTGGAINVVTRAPTDELTAFVSSSFGSFADRRIKMFVSGPLAFGFSASGRGAIGRSHEYYEPSPQSVVRGFPTTSKEARG